MKKILFLGLITCLSFCIIINSGYAEQLSLSSQVIQKSQTLKTVQEKTNYLIKQAQAFYSSKEFQQAIEVAQYVLSNLDRNSQPAKNLIEKAKAQLQNAAGKAVGDIGNKLLKGGK
jgi:hypothetical protein